MASRCSKQVHEFSDAIEIWNDALVWSVFESNQLAIARGNELVLLDAHAIIVATGAYERPVPVPGWTLPGCHDRRRRPGAFKKSADTARSPGAIGRHGPLQLVVANQMLDAGMEVVAVAESNTTLGLGGICRI